MTLFGDPRHTTGQSFNVGTAAVKNGVSYPLHIISSFTLYCSFTLYELNSSQSWPREGSQLEAENLWATKLHSYCADGDIACANGTSTAAHSSYFTSSYAGTPASWIKSKLT